MGCVETEACFSSDSLGQSSIVEVKNQMVTWADQSLQPVGKLWGMEVFIYQDITPKPSPKC